MPFRISKAALIASALVLSTLGATAARAQSDVFITSDAYAIGGTQTTSFGLDNGSTTTSVTLAGGGVLNFANADTVGVNGSGYAPFTNGYSGDILLSGASSATETISFAESITSLGFYVAPDVGIDIPGFLSNATITLTLSNGQTTTVPLTNFAAGDSAFVGFYGSGDVSSLTVSINGTNGFGGPITDFAFGGFESVPEPASLAGLATGVLALGLLRRRRA
jgi:hypothetical protein